jgi:hypothetical protein
LASSSLPQALSTLLLTIPPSSPSYLLLCISIILPLIDYSLAVISWTGIIINVGIGGYAIIGIIDANRLSSLPSVLGLLHINALLLVYPLSVHSLLALVNMEGNSPLFVSAGLAICVHAVYSQYVVHPVDDGSQTAGIDSKWIQAIGALSGGTILIKTVLNAGSVTSCSHIDLETVAYLLLRAAIYLPALVLIRRNYFYRKDAQKVLEIGVTLGGLAYAGLGVLERLHGCPKFLYCSVAILGFVLVWRIVAVLGREVVCLPPISLKNVLLISEAAFTALDPSQSSSNKFLDAFIISKHKLLDNRLRLNRIQKDGLLRMPTDIRKNINQRTSSSLLQLVILEELNCQDELTILERCQMVMAASFDVLLARTPTSDKLTQLVYLSYLVKYAPGYARTGVMLGRLKNSCKSLYHSVILKRILIEFEWGSKSQTSYLTQPLQAGFVNETNSADCGTSSTSQTSTGDGVASERAKSNLSALLKFQSLLAEMTRETMKVRDFFTNLSQTSGEVSKIHQSVSTIMRAHDTTRRLFDDLREMSGKQSNFHLVPFAQYSFFVFNEYRLFRDALREYTMKLKFRVLLSKNYAFDGIKETSVVMKASAESTSLGKILYEGGNTSILHGSEHSSYPTKSSDTRPPGATDPTSQSTLLNTNDNIFKYLFPSMQDEHLSQVNDFMNIGNKKYLGEVKERYIQIPESAICKKAMVVTTLSASIEDGLSFVLGFEVSEQEETFFVLDPLLEVVAVSEKIRKICKQLPELRQISSQLYRMVTSILQLPTSGQQVHLNSFVDLVEDKEAFASSPFNALNNMNESSPTADIVTGSSPLQLQLQQGNKRPDELVLDFGNDLQYKASLTDIAITTICLADSKSRPHVVLTFSPYVFLTSTMKRKNMTLISNLRLTESRKHLPSLDYKKIGTGVASLLLLKPAVELKEAREESLQSEQPHAFHRKWLASRRNTALRNIQKAAEVGNNIQGDHETIDLNSVASLQRKDVERIVALDVVSPIRLISRHLIFFIFSILIHVGSTILVCYMLDSYIGSAQYRLVFNQMFYKNVMSMGHDELMLMTKIRNKMMIETGIQSRTKYNFLISGFEIDPDKEIADTSFTCKNSFIKFYDRMTFFDSGMHDLVKKYVYQVAIPPNFTSKYIQYNKRKITLRSLILETEASYKTLLAHYKEVWFNSAEYYLASTFIPSGGSKTSTLIFNELVFQNIDQFQHKMRSTNATIIIIFCVGEVFLLVTLFVCYLIKKKIVEVYSIFDNLEDHETSHKIGVLNTLIDYFKELQFNSIFANNLSGRESMTFRGGKQVQMPLRFVSSKGQLLRSKAQNQKLNRFYFFNMKRLVVLILITLHISFAIMIKSMIDFSTRRQILNSILFNFRFVGRSTYVLSVIENYMTDLFLNKLGLVTYPTFAVQAKTITAYLGMLDDSNQYLRRHFDNFPPEEAEHFLNYDKQGDSCSLINFESADGFTPEVCRTMANGIFSRPYIQHLGYFRIFIADTLLKVKESADTSVVTALFKDRQWIELQFFVDRMVVPMFKAYAEQFEVGLRKYQDEDSSRTWRTIYLIQAILYTMSISFSLYLLSTLSSHTGVCIQSMKLLPSKSITQNAYVKIRMKNIRDK